MHTLVKLFIGLLIAIAGVYWYLADYVASGWKAIVGYTALSALINVFIGCFGAFLICFGLLVAWIEYEDWKWEQEEKRLREEEEKKRRKTRRRRRR